MSTETNPSNFRVIDLGAEAKKSWGPQWNKPEPSYEFNGRTFELRTEDAGIYNPE